MVVPVFLFASLLVYSSSTVNEVQIPSGVYVPFMVGSDGDSKKKDKWQPVAVPSFLIDTKPVTNEEFLHFVRKYPEWRRSNIPRIFSDASYLKHWRNDVTLQRDADKDQPVVNVSWFAASAFCQAQAKDLPTTDQWEYAIDDAGRDAEIVQKGILAWYSVPNAKVLPSVGSRSANGYGLYDLHGLIWEWTLDFNSIMMSSEIRSSGTNDNNLFCGAGSLNALDPSDQAKFLRYSMRSSLKASYTTSNLGFRCAREKKK